MNPILTQINTLPAGQKLLCLSNIDLYQMNVDDIVEAFSKIPVWVRSLDLSWNYPGHINTTQLIAIFESIPKTVMFLDLSGQSLHMRTVEDLIKLFSFFRFSKCTIETGNLKLNQFIKELTNKTTTQLPNKHHFLEPGSSISVGYPVPELPPSAVHVDAAIKELNIPRPFIYSLYKVSQESSTRSEAYLFKTQMKPEPLPTLSQIYFQINSFFKKESQKDTYYYLPEGSNAENPPITFKEMLDEHAFIKPTLVQLVDLMTRLIRVVDHTAEDYCYYASIDTIYIINSQDIGTEKLLKFKLCPSGLLAIKKLPSNIDRQTVHSRMVAIIFLLLATQSTRLDDEDLWPKLKKSLSLFPAFASAFYELWQFSLLPKQKDRNITLENLSPTISTFFKLREMKIEIWCTEHVPGLLTGMACYHQPVIFWNGTEGIYRLLNSTFGKQKQEIIGIIAQAIELVMPSSINGLEHADSEIKSQHWIYRLHIIKSVLQEAERSGDYERLHQLQSRLMKAGMGEFLFNTLFKPKIKYSSKVLTPIIMVAIWMAFQFDTIRLKLMHQKNILSWIKLLLEQGKKTGELNEYAHHVVMLLVMANFGNWSEKISGIAKLKELWEHYEPERFIECCYASSKLSPETNQLIINKLEHDIIHLMQGHQPITQRNQTVLTRALNFLHQLAWSADTQTTIESVKSLYHSNLLAIIMKKHNLSLFAAPLPSSPSDHSVQSLFNSLQQIDSIMLNDYPLVRQTFKLPIAYDKLQSAKTMPVNMASKCIPHTNKSGAPANTAFFYLSLTDHHLFEYGTTKSIIYTCSPDVLKKQNINFICKNISSAHRICTVKHITPEVDQGTYGAYLTHILDAGTSRDIHMGITWDLEEDDNYILPGTSATSVALDISTGVVKYLHAQTKQQVELQYTVPGHSGSTIIICITRNEVYFVVNNQIYPIIPNLVLPADKDIHPLIHIGCPGVSLKTEVMGSVWSLERTKQGHYIHASTNPLAHLLHFYSHRIHQCLHYRSANNYSFSGIKELSNSDRLSLLNEEQRMAIFMILLAKKSCGASTCIAPQIILSLLQELDKDKKTVTSQTIAHALTPEQQRLQKVTPTIKSAAFNSIFATPSTIKKPSNASSSVFKPSS